MVLSLSALLVSAMAAPAFADKGGFPSERNGNHACHGQTIRSDAVARGLTPPELAEQADPAFGIKNAGDYNKTIKDNPLFCAGP